MVAAFVLIAVQYAPPAPLPDRWLLKLVPDKQFLPELPVAFYGTEWFRNEPPFDLSATPRHLGIGFYRPGFSEWTRFHRGGDTRPATATFRTSIFERPPFQIPNASPTAQPATTSTARLAVHGPLVEYRRELHTAAVSELRLFGLRLPVLEEGVAVEVGKGTWYQVGMSFEEGHAHVREWRLTFDHNPRVETEGTVTIQGHRRKLTDPDGKVVYEKARFFVIPGSGPKRWVRFEPIGDPWGQQSLTLLAIHSDGPRGNLFPRSDYRVSVVGTTQPLEPAPPPPPWQLVEPPSTKKP